MQLNYPPPALCQKSPFPSLIVASHWCQAARGLPYLALKMIFHFLMVFFHFVGASKKVANKQETSSNSSNR